MSCRRWRRLGPRASSPRATRGQSGLGFRVPMLIVSPFSKGGFVPRDTFDHLPRSCNSSRPASGLRCLHLTRGGAAITGDLTSALNFAAVDPTLPSLPVTAPMDPNSHPECATEEARRRRRPGPTAQVQPAQERCGRPSPSGPVPAATVPEASLSALEVAAGAAAVAEGWWLRPELTSPGGGVAHPGDAG